MRKSLVVKLVFLNSALAVSGCGRSCEKDDSKKEDESAYYFFDADEIDVLEQAANLVQSLCLEAVEQVVRQNLFERFQLTREWAGYVTESWEQDEPTIYGRFDFGYAGEGQPKLLEY